MHEDDRPEDANEGEDYFTRGWMQLVHLPSKRGIGAYIRTLDHDTIEVDHVEINDLLLPDAMTDELLVRLYTYWPDFLADAEVHCGPLEKLIGLAFKDHADPNLATTLIQMIRRAIELSRLTE